VPGKTIEAGNRLDQFDYFYQLGQYYFQSHEWNASIMVLNRALELQPTHQDAQLLLAYALLLGYKSKQDLLEGERLFQQVLQTVPTYTDATEGLKKVKTLLLKRERDKQSTAKKETWVESYLTLAKEFTRQGNYGAVVEIYLVLAKAFPKNAEYLFELGLTYNRMEQHCEAITAFEQALDLKPDYSDALIALGNQYLFFKDFETSNQLFSLAAHAAPQDPDAWLA
jgi:tetratricopeptide (TPR) repeat protein